MINGFKIGVVIPCYKESAYILDVLTRIGEEIDKIYVIDDCCPEDTGILVEKSCVDPRVSVLKHVQNTGVGGAVKSGYRAACHDQVDIIVKIDGDGQMDPALIPTLISPLMEGLADYTKGNRFYNLEHLRSMPKIRLFGNACLSFLNKAMSGYWNIMDPTNGYTAILARTVKELPLNKIENGYFFESDMLFRLNTIRAVVMDIEMEAMYSNETSSLSISKFLLSFPTKFITRFYKRIFYNYFLRDFHAASIELILGILLMLFGLGIGIYKWHESSITGIFTSSGTVMLSALPLLMGFQLLLSFLHFDISNQPRRYVAMPLSRRPLIE